MEIGGAIEMKELPFVVGVLGDFSGQPAEQLPRLKDRKLVEIDRDNFDQVLAAQAPRLALRVDNKLSDDGSKMNVELRFNNIDGFRARAGSPAGRAAPQARRGAPEAP